MKLTNPKLKNGAARLAQINEQIAAGRTVYVCTATRQTKITPKTLRSFEAFGGLFKVDATGSLWMRSGRKFVCVDFCQIVAR